MKADKAFIRNIVEHVIPFNEYIGLKLDDVEEGKAILRLPFRPEFIGDPRSKALHGGLISMAMDTAGGVAGMTTLGSMEDKLSTIDIRIDYLRPGRAEDLIVEGQITRSGNRIIVTQMKAYHPNDGQLIAEGKGVYNVKRKLDGSTN